MVGEKTAFNWKVTLEASRIIGRIHHCTAVYVQFWRLKEFAKRKYKFLLKPKFLFQLIKETTTHSLHSFPLQPSPLACWLLVTTALTHFVRPCGCGFPYFTLERGFSSDLLVIFACPPSSQCACICELRFFSVKQAKS